MMSLASWMVMVSLLAGQNGTPTGHANATAESGTPAAQLDPEALPVNLDRIQRALSKPPAIRLQTGRTVFRVEVFGRKLSIEDILGPDYLKGPTPAGAMTHREFLNLVTPKDVQGYAAFDNKQAASVALSQVTVQVIGWALQKALRKYKEATADREREAARKEVEEALAELRRARRAAGLPDK